MGIDTERPDSLERLAAVMASVEGTRSRLEKRRILVGYLHSLPEETLAPAATFLTGHPFPRADSRKLSIGGATLSRALLAARPGLTTGDLEAAWLRHSDAGDTAAAVWQGTPIDPPPSLSLPEVANLFSALHRASGPTQKIPLLVEAFRRMSPRAIRAFVKVMMGETRSGLGEGTVEDAVAHASGCPLEAVRAANRHRADLGAVALDIRRGSLPSQRFMYFNPVDPMLAQPATDAAEALRRLGTPLFAEDKYDGVRCQLHKVGSEVRLFSRDRKDITRQFPDVAAGFAAAEGRYVLDGEILVMEQGRPLPFMRLQQRLNRIAPTPDVIAACPVALVAFDCLVVEDEGLLEQSLRDRRARLERLRFPAGQLVAPVSHASTAEEVEALFAASRERGNEGLMCKDPASPYVSGRRGYRWLKLKRPLDTLDVVIVGAEWGHGKRRAVLSDYTFAVRDEATGALLTIGKAYGGLTDAEIAELTQQLKTITLAEEGRFRAVRPEIVLEVTFNHIQRSDRHTSGFALRFPRIVRIRPDKSPADISTLADVARLHAALTRSSLSADSTSSQPDTQTLPSPNRNP